MKRIFGRMCKLCVALGSALGTFVACDQAPAPSFTMVRRDSAQITISENGSGASTLRLGPVFDSARGQRIDGLHLSRVSAARLMADGRIVLTDNAARQLVIVDPRSNARKTVGRPGPGPEEFSGVFRSIWRCLGDTLVVRSGLNGLKVFDSSGVFVRMDAAPRMQSASYGASDDCTSVVISVPKTSTGRIFMRDTSTMAWYDLERDSVVDVLTVLSRVKQMVPYLGDRMPVQVPFAEDWHFAVSGNHLYAGLSGTPEVRVYDRGGRLVRLIRWAVTPSVLTRSDKAKYNNLRRQLDERVRPGTSAQVPNLSVFTLPEMKPLFSQLRVDDDGYVWVRKFEIEEAFERTYGPRFAETDPEWWIFEPSGRLIGSVTTPRDFIIKDTRNGMALGLRVDEDDVPHVYVVPIMTGIFRSDSARTTLRD